MITQIRAVDRNGFGGVAQERSVRVEVKWQLLYASCAAGAGNAVPFVDSAGYWAHTALVLASPGNAADVVFGPTSRADCRVLAPGTEYQIPAVYPNIEGAWAVFDLAEWYFRCDTAAATIIIMYV